MKAETGSVQHSSYSAAFHSAIYGHTSDYNPGVDPWNPGGLCSAACWLLISYLPRGCAVAICLVLLPTDRYLALLSILSFGVFQNGLVGLDRLPEGKPCCCPSVSTACQPYTRYFSCYLKFLLKTEVSMPVSEVEDLRLTQDTVSFVLEPYMGPLCKTGTQTRLPKEEKSGLSHATQDKNGRVLLTPHKCYSGRGRQKWVPATSCTGRHQKAVF